ncbi:hypothetical protein N9Y42_06765 [Mariniblastus sp.]|nr:hypothetical protein [Mariniblastus sp.]
MDQPIINEYQWLVGSEAATLLSLAHEDFLKRLSPLKIAKTLRKSTTLTRAALIMEQTQLRIRAKPKFSLADQMFFTKRGLEQSSGVGLAIYKASHFRGHESVLDVCCGIGGDLLGLANRDPGNNKLITTGIDSDPVTALFAEHNLQQFLKTNQIPHAAATVLAQDFTAADLNNCSAIHLDPDRRKARRATDGRHFSPSLTDVFSRISDSQMVAVKVAPATPMEDSFPKQLHRQWLGDRRECKQQVLWLGADFSPSQRTASVVMDDGSAHHVSCEGIVDVDRTVAPGMKQYLFEPHSAVLAAKLEDHLAAKHELGRIARSIPYFVSDVPVQEPLLAGFKVIELLKMDLKSVHRYLNDNDVGEIELKQRGIDNVTFERFRKLKLTGSKKATLFLTRYGAFQKRRAIVASRLSDDFAG